MLKIGNIQILLTNLLYGVITLIIPLILFATVVECKDIEVTAVVSPRYIQYNEKATLELTISGKTQLNHIGSPQFNLLPNFLAVPLDSGTIPRLVDDKVTVTMGWVYELIPQKIGEIALPDISFLYQGVPYIANPGKIIVASTDTYHNTSTGGIHKVVAEVENQKPYIHEGIEYRFRYLYTTILPTVESPTPSLPNFNGFVVEKLNDEKNTTTKVGSKTFYVQEYVRRLYPQNIGKILIDSSELKLPLKNNPKTLKTEAIPLNVQPLPENGRPTNFSGAVGNFSITAQVDRKKLKVKNAITLSLRILGQGYLKNLTLPNISSIRNLRVEPPTQVKEGTGDNFLFNYVVVPIKSGILQIPAIEFSFFNPTTKTYQTTYTEPIQITVIPTTSVTLDSASSFPYWTLWLLSVLIVGMLIAAGILFYRSNRKIGSFSSSSDASQSHIESISVSIDSLEDATIDMNSTSFGEELTRILHQFLCNMIDEPYRQLTIAEVREICNHVEVPQPTIEEIIEILTKGDYHKFAPVSLSTVDSENLISRLKAVLKHLETIKDQRI